MKLPQRIGRYQVIGHLATGGMAEILLGKLLGPSGFERAVVIKRILPHLAVQEKFVEMFLDEARTVAGIRHPNVIQVHELGRDGEELFLVMEYLEGENLSSLARRCASRQQRLDPALCAYVVAQACAGLHAAHELTDVSGVRQNLVHRDVSPSNVVITYSGEIKVLDFGIARVSNRMSRTEVGQMKGKFSYMSPEQCRGEPLDRRSDVFGAGIVLFELLTCRRLFARPSELMVLKAICEQPVPAPSRVVPGLPPALDAICQRALARRPQDRYQTSAEMRRELLSAIRTRGGPDLPEEALGAKMRELFADRIEQKQEMLRRVRAGSDVTSVPAEEVEIEVDLPSVVADPDPVTAATQLSGEVSPSRLRPQRRARPWVAAIVLAALTGAVSYALVTSGDFERRGRAGSAGGEPVLVEAPRPRDPEAPPPPSPSPPAEVVIHLETSPPGATVKLADEPMGSTPLDMRLPRSASTLLLSVSHEGYLSWSDEIRPDVDQRLRIVLTRHVRGPQRPAGSRGSAPRPVDGFHRFD